MIRKLFRVILFKISTIVTLILYPNVAPQYRFFIRYYFIGRIYQLKYLTLDYIFRKEYKVIDYNSEFSPELKFVLPHAYWHFCNGTLRKTIASKGTSHFYFFSTDHEEKYDTREWVDFEYDISIPNSVDHNFLYDYTKWKQVPLKKQYQNKLISFDKPILIIANKFNIEWGEKPINYLSNSMIKQVYSLYHRKYQIIYNRPGSENIVSDESEILSLGDKEFITANLEEVILMENLYEKNKKYVANYNHLQLLVYANASKFISVHGGTATLASYFGGTNIIYSKRGFETYFGEYDSIYRKLSGANIIHAKNEGELTESINNYL